MPGEISITSDMQMTPPLWQKVKKTKKPLDESERGESKTWLQAQHSENEDHGIRSHHLKNFPQFVVIHTVKGFGIVNNAEIDVFLELSCFVHDPEMLAI